MDAEAPWTLDELTARVAVAIDRLGLLQPNGQVAEAPNARAVRWYQSTGLVRRPQQRGRVAYYGPAHLRELVAIKRLQSNGLTLEQVQQQLLSQGDDAVTVLADVPADLEDIAPAPASSTAAAPRPRSFWSEDVIDPVVDSAQPLTVSAPRPAPSLLHERIALDHPAGVTVVFPTRRAPTADDVQAILSVVVDQLIARGLLAKSPVTEEE